MSDALRKLHNESENARALLAAVEHIITDDDVCRADTVEGETNLPDAIDAAYQFVLDREALQAANDKEIATLKARNAAFESQIGRAKDAIRQAIGKAGLKSLATRKRTYVCKRVPPVAVPVDEAQIPERFWVQPPAPAKRIDKTALLAALKEGEVAGAILSNGGETLAVRVA